MNNKIDSYSELVNTSIGTKMKPIYGTNYELNCGTIEYGGKFYLLEHKDKDKIINFDKNFVFNNTENEDYPSYTSNYKRYSYLDFIFNFNKESCYYHFKNENKYDLRRCNVEIYHDYHKIISNKYTIIEYTNGHINSYGQDANIMKNPLWKIKENDIEYLLMYCEKDTICKLCPQSYQKIIDYENNNNNGNKITWYKHLNGYICSSIGLYIHQIITGCYGNGLGTKNISVDHIDQNPLNNTIENLRIATRKEQEQNSKGIKPGTKRERKHSAKELPIGITQDMMKKYVVYYQEWLDKERTKQRDFFKVEKHPKLDKPWCTTKSNKISIKEKLEEANKVVDDLDNDIYPVKNEINLPKYVSIVINREKPHLVFEKRVEGKRLGLKMVLPEEYDLEEQICILNEKIKEKYNINLFEGTKIDKFKYKLCVDLDDINKNIDKITFNISRYRKYKHTIVFNEFVTQKYAVENVEEWLSEKVTIEYYNKIKDDLFNSLGENVENILIKNRGDLLTDCIFLEELTYLSTHLFIDCGS